MIFGPNDDDDTLFGTFQIKPPVPAVENTPEEAAALIKEVTQARKEPLPEPEPAPEPLPEIELLDE